MKKFMLKTILITFVMFTTMVANAQRGERMDPKVRAKTTVDAWEKALKLTEDQKTKAYDHLIAANETRTKKFQELRDSGDRDGMREAFTKMQEESDKELKKIFTEEQWPLYEKWKKDEEAKRGNRRGGGGN